MKRRKTMTYNKPEVTKLDRALDSIQGTQKGGSFGSDHLVPVSDPRYGTADLTINAYESDE
jgi:hypothetical protein